MEKLALAMLAACALATSFAPAASAYPPSETVCGFTSVTDPNPETPENTESGYLMGGPVMQSGTITCTIKAGVGTHAGTTPNSATASASGSNGVAFFPPTAVSYMSPPETNVYLCQQFDDGTTTWVLDGVTWVDLALNPDATCGLGIGTGTAPAPSSIRPST